MSVFGKIKESVMQKSRSEKLEHFYSLCDQNASVLDVGVSDNEHNDSINLFLRNFRLDSSQYTGLAVEPMDGIRKQHPNKRFVEYPGGVFPFADQEFDWVFSNAVIEHVGNPDDQLLFLNEMLRVSKNVFFTTPNKWFPIESHTNVFFRHWFDNHFYQWCETNQPYWNRNNLLLLGKKHLTQIVTQSKAKRYDIQSNCTFGWPMTYTVVCSME